MPVSKNHNSGFSGQSGFEVSTLPGAKDIIPGELSKRVHRIFPDADVRVKPMMTLPSINIDASKHEKEQISRTVQELFEEADMWLVSD
ncbi:DinI family protein [Citrobacter europaeus]|uniref:DinI family protein n=1 Tax=Citrobacter europaeus TaxID=1914243 RepID=UPI003AAF2228